MPGSAVAVPSGKKVPKIDPQAVAAADGGQTQDYNPPDPRTNLPFAQAILGFGSGGPGISPGKRDPDATNSGQDLQRHLVAHGHIIEAGSFAQRLNGNFALYFMFNPTDLQLSYNFDSAEISNSNRQADLRGPSLAQNRNLAIDLVFDRTYEVWWGSGPQGEKDGPYKYGAQWDGRAAERLVGMYDARNNSLGQAMSPPTQVPVECFFGGPGALKFGGMIQSLSVNYTRFANDMTPIRCEVSIGMTEVLKASSDGTASSSTPSTDPAQTMTPHAAGSHVT